ncbi:MAG: hypothetical protein ACRC76_08465 [Proteocatella sp.]
MKTKKIILSILLVLSILLSGCSTESASNEDVTTLKKTLLESASSYSKEYFQKELILEDFDISLAEEISDNSFDDLKDTSTKNPIYLSGLFKNEPKDITSFLLIYQDGKIIKFGIETLEKEMTFAELK